MIKRLLVVLAFSVVLIHSLAFAGNGEELLQAIKSRNDVEIERLLQADANPNLTGSGGMMPIHWAAAVGSPSAIELLIRHRAVVNARTLSGYTPLHFAAYYKRTEAAKMLVANGADVNAVTEEGYTPFFKVVEPFNFDGRVLPKIPISAANEITSLAAFLLEKGGVVQVQNHDGLTPLHFAAALGIPDILNLMIGAGADPGARARNSGITPLHVAAQFDQKDAIDTLLRKGANISTPNSNGLGPLEIAVDYGNASAVEALLKQGANPNTKTRSGAPLLMAVLEIEYKKYNIQIHRAFDPSSPWYSFQPVSQKEKTEFDRMLTVRKHEWPKVAKHLVAFGADVNTTHLKAVPIYLAASLGDRELVELLLSKGARINVALTERMIESPLHAAIAESHKDIVELLIKKGADIDVQNASQRTPLHFLASFIKDGSLAEMIVSRGAKLNAEDNNGDTPYDFALRSGNQEVATVLKQFGGKSGKSSRPKVEN